MFDKEAYRKRREAGERGQEPATGFLVNYTPANQVVQGEYGSRKGRRRDEVRMKSLERKGRR